MDKEVCLSMTDIQLSYVLATPSMQKALLALKSLLIDTRQKQQRLRVKHLYERAYSVAPSQSSNPLWPWPRNVGALGLGACGSGGRAVWLVTGRLLVRAPTPPRVPRCPWAGHLILTAPDKLAVALHGRRRRPCVNVCMNGWMLGNIVKRFGWSLVTENALYKCSPFTVNYFNAVITWLMKLAWILVVGIQLFNLVYSKYTHVLLWKYGSWDLTSAC